MSIKGMLIVISGPSGSGKGTVVNELRKNEMYALSVSMTTRLPRLNEKDSVDYFFRTKEEFLKIREADGFLEHAEFVGNMYGTPKSYVEEKINEGKAVILEIDVIGALQVKKIFNECILIFLIPPTKEILRERLIGRNTEDAIIIERRLKKAEDEITQIDNYDYLIINDKVLNAVNQISCIVSAERLKPKNCKLKVKEFIGGE